MLIAIYAVRPLLMLQSKEFDFYGINVFAGFREATFIGFVGILSLIVGFAGSSWAFGSNAGQGRPQQLKPTELFNRGRLASGSKAANIIAVALLLLWLLTMIVVGGGLGFLAVLFAGRSEAVDQVLVNVPAVIPALPTIAALVIAGVRFREERRGQVYRASQSVSYWFIAALCVIPPSALGTRRFLIPSLVAVLLGAISINWARRIKFVWVLGGVAAFFVLAVFPFVRSADSRQQSSDLAGAMIDYFRAEGLVGILNSFFLSYDTEMFNYVSYLAPRLGETVPFGLGRGTLVEALLAPLPAAIAPLETWSNQLLLQIFGGTCSQVYCPVPSVVGLLYYDLSFPGLIIGMLLLGLLASRFEHALLSGGERYVSLLLLLGGFSVTITRGNSVSQLWIALQCLAVLLLANAAVRLIAKGEWLMRYRLHGGSPAQGAGSRMTPTSPRD